MVASGVSEGRNNNNNVTTPSKKKRPPLPPHWAFEGGSNTAGVASSHHGGMHWYAPNHYLLPQPHNTTLGVGVGAFLGDMVDVVLSSSHCCVLSTGDASFLLNRSSRTIVVVCTQWPMQVGRSFCRKTGGHCLQGTQKFQIRLELNHLLEQVDETI